MISSIMINSASSKPYIFPPCHPAKGNPTMRLKIKPLLTPTKKDSQNAGTPTNKPMLKLLKKMSNTKEIWLKVYGEILGNKHSKN